MQQTLSTASNFADPDAAYRMIVEAHRGRLWLAAQEGTGATFQFSLPVYH